MVSDDSRKKDLLQERKKWFLKQFSRIKFLGVIAVTVPTVSSVKRPPPKNLSLEQTVPHLPRFRSRHQVL